MSDKSVLAVDLAYTSIDFHNWNGGRSITHVQPILNIHGERVPSCGLIDVGEVGCL